MRHIFLALLLFVSIASGAQLKVIAESPSFSEPEHGYAQVVMLKNGNTAYLRVTPKDGIDVKIYDAQFKEIAAKTLEPNYGKLKGLAFRGAYDINNEICVFVSEVEDAKPTLYQIRINAQSGDLIAVKTLATLDELKMSQGYAAAFGGVPLPAIYTYVDKESGHFAAVRFNTFVDERTQRVELIQYAPDGSEKHRNFLSSSEAKYKYTEIFDVALRGADAYALLYGYNTPSSGGAANELLLATIKDGTVSYKNIGKAFVRKINSGILQYNSVTGNLVFLTTERTGVKNLGMGRTVETFSVSLNVINPASGEVIKTIPFRQSGLNMKYRKVFGDNEFRAMVNAMNVNADGSISVLVEHEEDIVRTNLQTGGSRSTTVLGSAGVLTFSEDGKEISSSLIPKQQTLANVMFNPSVAGSCFLNGGNQFKSVFYVNSKNKTYVLMNDVEENAELIAKGKLVNVRGLGDCDAWVYDLSTNISSALPIPSRTIMFPKERNKDRSLGLFAASDFNSKTGVLATIKVEKGNASIVWLSEL